MRKTPFILFTVFFYVFMIMAAHVVFSAGWSVFAGGLDAMAFVFAMVVGKAVTEP